MLGRLRSLITALLAFFHLFGAASGCSLGPRQGQADTVLGIQQARLQRAGGRPPGPAGAAPLDRWGAGGAECPGEDWRLQSVVLPVQGSVAWSLVPLSLCTL